MKTLFRVTLLSAALAAAGAGAFTIPNHAPYDALLTWDPGARLLAAHKVEIKFGAANYEASRIYDDAGIPLELSPGPYSIETFAAPCRLEYSFDGRYSIAGTVQLLRAAYDYVPPMYGATRDLYSIGVGDVWFVGKAVFDVAPALALGPRAGVKMTIRRNHYESPNAPLSDGQWDYDGALVADYRPHAAFDIAVSLGGRYRQEPPGNIPYKEEVYDEYIMRWYKLTWEVRMVPAPLFYALVKPAFSLRNGAFRCSFPCGYVFTGNDNNTLATYTYDRYWPSYLPKPRPVVPPDAAHMICYAGLAPAYNLSSHTTVGLELLYPLAGKNTPRGVFAAATMAVTVGG